MRAMGLVIRTYVLTFTGTNIVSWPCSYTWWDRFWARIHGHTLPEVQHSNRCTVTIKIQGNNAGFMDREIAYRQGHHLSQMKQQCPDAEMVSSYLLCSANNLSGKLIRDYSPGQSPEYREWVRHFGTVDGGIVLSDTVAASEG